MASITIDGKEYDSEILSEDAKGQITSLQIIDRKIADLTNDIKIMQTARNAYAKALEKALPKQKQ